MIVLLTGTSGSGKTTVTKALGELGWKFPLNFSTRSPRGDDELDNYVFLKREDFITKLVNGDFMEFTMYNGNFYGITKYFNKDINNLIIVDPVGREMLSEYFCRNNIKFRTIYLEIDDVTQIDRLFNRGDSKEEIKKRKNDFKWFFPTPNCLILDGLLPTGKLANLINNLGDND